MAKRASYFLPIFCCSSVAQSCPSLCDPMDCSTTGFPVLHQLQKLAQTHLHQMLMPFNHLILYCFLCLLPSIFPSIRVFPDESALRIRWPEYWSFSFSIGPSNEYDGGLCQRLGRMFTLIVGVQLLFLFYKIKK